jgi:NADH-quinone oxidoreductase subunit L
LSRNFDAIPHVLLRAPCDLGHGSYRRLPASLGWCRMSWIAQHLWLVPALPILAAGVCALLKQRQRRMAATLAVASMSAAFILSAWAFASVLRLNSAGSDPTQVVNFRWLEFGDQVLKLGWVLDPLSAVMLAMVTFVSLLVFIYSIGYMKHDENFTRFFCFLMLFAGAMLGLVLANSLLLLFMCWEVVGLTSYLLIGFWYASPQAAAAAKKAFIVTRIGDLAFLLGIVWLYGKTGTLLFYDGGAGCIEPTALAHLVAQTTIFGMALSTGIGLLIFCGAVGKSGQVPLHVWLPDAMEGPTPVSALIHAATMVAAGVYLIARMYPLISAHAGIGPSGTLQAVTWVGTITAVAGALIAVAQFDIKRILAYSTISQLGYMMVGLGVGGVAVGMFHLITHAFFKSLLFLGAGSVIHGCHGEQDIRRMGGLRKSMPWTFATYGVGMLALSGFPLFFSGFWSKDEILHAAHGWSVSHAPYYLCAFGALLTAFYMTRQIFYVFAGNYSQESSVSHSSGGALPHESSAIMAVPLAILAAFAVFLGLIGTPAWPWFQSFLEQRHAILSFSAFAHADLLAVMTGSSLLVFLGLGLGWWLYGRKKIKHDPIERMAEPAFTLLSHGFYVDALYAATFIRWNAWFARACSWLDQWVWNGAVQAVSHTALALAWLDNLLDTSVVNPGFDEGCITVTRSGQMLGLLQNGLVQSYLRILGLALIVLVLFLVWGARG